MALTANSATVETTSYRDWPHFRSILEIALQATEKLTAPRGAIRVGVRYVNEVRVDGVEDQDWRLWLSPSVLPPAAQDVTSTAWTPVAWAGVAQYVIGEERYLVLRHGPHSSGFAVNPDGPLRRPVPRQQGPFFLLDFDAYWEPSTVPGWDSDRILDTCDQLHEPVQAFFDEVVTDRLVADVFSREEDK